MGPRTIAQWISIQLEWPLGMESKIPCWILYFHSEIILTHSPTIINKTKKNLSQNQNKKNNLLYLLFHKPCLLLALSPSLSTNTLLILFTFLHGMQNPNVHLFAYIHTYIYYWLDSANEGEHGGFFLWDWITSISIIHSKSIHFPVKFLITFFFRVDTILFYNIPNFHYSSVDGQLN